ncbi:HET-domain-containing protein [Polyporus arcularius HHB13444]|uniref:HET-domain-containing protein n=1 Tax=Polyporus arcularius HHB13444 TaxID=1314778 RepID=A0A5C3NMM0_9APHY|nr:HET-domain-containing protein [Polyporus arcularius HHB13444]
MRLIVTETGQFVEINDPAKHVYAILSHTWDPEGEQSYREIKRACAIARQYGYRLLWIDSCCIEKESSAELSEAINSMFNWYTANST